MKRKTRAVKRVLLLVAAMAVYAVAQAAENLRLNRSLYIPIEIHVCEHLQHAILYQDDLAVAELPAKRIFQFTYYPDLVRIAPEVIRLRVEGVDTDQEPFLARLSVTPDGVFTSRGKVVEFDTSKAGKMLRFKIDARYEDKVIRLRCAHKCARADTQAAQGQGGGGRSSP